MDKQQKQIAIIVVLVLVMVIAWGNTFKTLKARSGPPVPKTSYTPPAVKLQALQSVTSQAVQTTADQNQDAGWGRDPFSGKLYVAKEGAAGYALTGIIWDTKNPQALINDEVYGKGSKIDKYTVEDILPGKVVLDDGVREIELSIE